MPFLLDVEAEEGRPRIVELRCRDCGYGAACRRKPERCPICGGADWAETKIERAAPGDSSSAVLSRAVNRRVRELGERGDGRLGFVCECDGRCFATVELTAAEFDLALDEDASIVAPGHERAGARVIDKTERYVLVAG